MLFIGGVSSSDGRAENAKSQLHQKGKKSAYSNKIQFKGMDKKIFLNGGGVSLPLFSKKIRS